LTCEGDELDCTVRGALETTIVMPSSGEYRSIYSAPGTQVTIVDIAEHL